MTERTSIAVAVCTYNRNEPLRVLLDALVVAAAEVRDLADVGVVVVDDRADGAARPVVERYENAFALGVHYRVSGRQNISLARNLALETALGVGEWIAMTDDDCEPVPGWLREHLLVQGRTGADAVTGPMKLRVPPGSPRWLEEQPFFADQLFPFVDGQRTDTAATNNSFLRSAFVREHPELRFRPELGVLGGEDMVFYRSAHRAGLQIVYSEQAAVWGNEPLERATFAHQLRYRFWLGNTEYVTNRALGDATPLRLFVRGVNGLRRSLQRPFVRLAHRKPPQWRYTLAAVLRSTGLLLGPLGVRRRHH
jgi:succinoglycan biosynthesis protein ExoM